MSTAEKYMKSVGRNMNIWKSGNGLEELGAVLNYLTNDWEPNNIASLTLYEEAAEGVWNSWNGGKCFD